MLNNVTGNTLTSLENDMKNLEKSDNPDLNSFEQRFNKCKQHLSVHDAKCLEKRLILLRKRHFHSTDSSSLSLSKLSFSKLSKNDADDMKKEKKGKNINNLKIETINNDSMISIIGNENNNNCNSNFVVENQRDNEILLNQSLDYLALNNLINCKVYCRLPVNSSVNIRNCQDCTIKLIAHQIRCYNSVNILLDSKAINGIVLEQCRDISITDYANQNTLNRRKVAILGAAGGIGQPLSLLMKMETNSVSHLALYDIVNMGMSVDLSHISTNVKVTGHSGETQLSECLDGANIVMIPAGIPRKPGMTRDDLFNINAGIVKKLTSACAQYCPDAHLLIISNPINSTVPIAYESMKALGVAKPNVFGVTTLDLVRARTFVGELKHIPPEEVKINVIGGHSGPTIVPLLSGIKNVNFTQNEVDSITKRVQYGGDEVVKAKDGGGSATLSMAFAAREFYRSFVQALNNSPNSLNSNLVSFVKCDLVPSGYCATEIELDSKGLVRTLPLPEMNEHEKGLFKIATNDLEKDVRKGIEFAQKPLTL